MNGISENKIPATRNHEHDIEPINSCKNIVNSWIDAPNIRCGQTKAAYASFLDKILMPVPRVFFEDEQFINTLDKLIRTIERT